MNANSTPPRFDWGTFYALLLLPPTLALAGGFIWAPLSPIIGLIGAGMGVYCGILLYRGINAGLVLNLPVHKRYLMAFVCCFFLFVLSITLNFGGCVGGLMIEKKAKLQGAGLNDMTIPPSR